MKNWGHVRRRGGPWLRIRVELKNVCSLRSVELSLIDEVFRGGKRGYVLDFSNKGTGLRRRRLAVAWKRKKQRWLLWQALPVGSDGGVVWKTSG